MYRLLSCRSLVLCSAALLTPVPALANGFANEDVSVVATGQANAGITAGTDVGASARNPAVVAKAEGVELAVGGFYRTSGREGTASVGGATADVEGDFLVGSGALAYRFNDTFSAGVAVYQPLRLKTEYPATFPSAGDIIYDHLTAVTIQPNVAVSLGNLHLGGGFGFTSLDASLAQATLTGPGTLDGDDWAHHWSVGLLYEIGNGGSIGLSYRSETDFNFDAAFSNPFTVPTPGGPLNIGGPAQVSGDFPASASAGFIVPLGERAKFSGEIMWTDWSDFQTVSIATAPGPVIPLDNTTKDTWYFAAGLEYTLPGGAAIRGGVAYDESSIRTPPGNVRFPYDDAIKLALGGSLPLGDRAWIDAALSHAFMGDSQGLVVNGAPGSSVSFNGGHTTFALGVRFGI